MTDPADRHVTAFQLQADWCTRLGSPLYARILDACVASIQAKGIVSAVVGDWAGDPTKDLIALRMLGAVHKLVLLGEASELAAHYPSVGGTVQGDETCRVFLDVLEHHRTFVRERLALPPQTNEVRRSAVLLGGFLEIARRASQPLALLEVGASAGLNLAWDRYRYELGPHRWGDESARVCLRSDWRGGTPRWDVVPEIRSRRGCDLEPIDITDLDQRLELEAFVWPDQDERFHSLEAAIEVAAEDPPRVDAEPAQTWLVRHLEEAPIDAVVVVYHSIVWTYLSEAKQASIRQILEEVGRTRSSEAPLCWLRFEDVSHGYGLTLTTWPTGRDELLARAQPHGAWIEWYGTP